MFYSVGCPDHWTDISFIIHVQGLQSKMQTQKWGGEDNTYTNTLLSCIVLCIFPVAPLDGTCELDMMESIQGRAIRQVAGVACGPKSLLTARHLSVQSSSNSSRLFYFTPHR